MSVFYDRVFSALGEFTASLAGFLRGVEAHPADPPRLPRKDLEKLIERGGRARVAADQLIASFRIVEHTGVDLVDLQVRIQEESTRLASALSALGEHVARQHFVREAFEKALVELDERAQLVSAAIFPSAVQGLRRVNVKLWEFEPLQWKRYTGILTTVVQQKKITSDQQARIQEIADGVREGFTHVNDFLNELAEGGQTDGGTVQARVARARRALASSLREARRRMTKAHSMFQGVVRASARIAGQVDTLLSDLRIPIFPPHDRLDLLSACIDRAAYGSLTGVQRFALLNIAARMRGTQVAGEPLLCERYDIRVNRVFPDRIYFDAERALIDAVAGDAGFQKAPATLHRFSEGSFKQRTFRKGNLQFSFASRAGGRVDIDADVDLYRGAVPHLFGEVLVNHLTGSVTDQFAVRRVLDSQQVTPIAGFEVLRV